MTHRNFIQNAYSRLMDFKIIRKSLDVLEQHLNSDNHICKALRGLTHPVERDQFLFAKTGSGLFFYSVVLTLFVLLCIAVLSGFLKALYYLVVLFVGNENFSIYTFDQEWEDTSTDPNFLWAIICQFLDPGNVVNAHGFGGSFIALLCAVAGIVCLSGFFVTSMVNMISRMTDQWKNGLLHYDWHFDKYVVIIGVNKQTAAIVKRSLKRDDVDYVLIQTRQNVDKMRNRLDLDLDKVDEEKIVFYYAERISNEDIEQLRLEKAVEVYILGEDMQFENEEDHDAFNIECLEHVSKYMEDERVKAYRHNVFGDNSRLTCHVDFEYQSTFTAFKATHIYQRLDKVVEFLPFNVHEIWAKKVLVDNFAVVPSGKKGEVTVQRYNPLDGEGITPDSNKTVRLIVMGMNQMGTAFGMQAALLLNEIKN